MKIDEQYSTLQRMLAQRMIRHAETILRQWAIEVDDPSYYDRLRSLNKVYDMVFDDYLSTAVHYAGEDGCEIDDARDASLDMLTRDCYDLMDDLYLAIQHKRGLIPTLSGFGPDNPDSILNYFAQRAPFREEDIEWLEANINDEERATLMTSVVSAIACNLRLRTFNEDMMLLLVRCCRCPVEPVAHQAMAQLIVLLAHFDDRITYYPEIQKAINDLVGESETMYFVLVSLISDNEFKKMDKSVGEFFQQIVERLPQTGIFNAIVNRDEQREQVAKAYVEKGLNESAFDGVLMGRADLINDAELRADYDLYNELYEEALRGYESLIESGKAKSRTYFRAGWCALMVGDMPHAEQYMLVRLREKKPVVEDYLNYAHLCFVRGDKVTAYEYYCEARRHAGSIRKFKDTFCPDRKVLCDMGIPLQEIYLMEDRVTIQKDK